MDVRPFTTRMEDRIMYDCRGKDFDLVRGLSKRESGEHTTLDASERSWISIFHRSPFWERINMWNVAKTVGSYFSKLVLN